MQFLWVLSLLFMTCLAAQTIHNQLPTDLVCTPAGDCEPCPADSLQEPFCQPFGSRRLMHCVTANGTTPIPPSAHPPPAHTGHTPLLPPDDRALRLPSLSPPPRGAHDQKPRADPAHTHAGETLAWAACGRILAQERADFLEWVACNLLFAAVAFFGVYTRARRQRVLQARQLAARIGLGGR
ncbi:hypothetical protein B0H16DRAFT_1598605 [Mycena metata]|uniref:Uncharacterized protein n=1 Tax=Mycena metata TaxID=1033252 RepID=A0AAD7HLA0_9AGAR|nr:hypothetical protein B0H16DRAFT_1598605 [Mycena metata]